MSEEASPDETRKRLAEIDDELRTLPDDEFALKHRLNVEAEQGKARIVSPTEGGGSH